MLQNLSILLTKYYIKAGFTAEEYIVLNAYLNHSKVNQDKHDLNEVAEMTGKSLSEVLAVLKSLFEKRLILSETEKEKINLMALYKLLSAVEFESMSINERISESIDHYARYAYHSDEQHFGQVTLVPFAEGGIAVAAGTESKFGSLMWSHNDMKKLVEEITYFLESTEQDWINEYNKDLKEKIDLKKEQQRIAYEERKAQKEEPIKPKHGYVILIRLYPSGYYKFTYTVSNDLNAKINRLKEEYGHNVEIVHSVETYDTIKFYYQFAKKQFSNRLIEKTMYQLTEEDVQFFKEEKYPANAMDWLEGSRIK